MKKGDHVVVIKGQYKGAQGTIETVKKNVLSLRLSRNFIIRNDEDGDDEWYNGEILYSIRKEDCSNGKDAELLLLDEKLREKVMDLRGLMLRRKYLTDPRSYEVDMEKILEAVDV